MKQHIVHACVGMFLASGCAESGSDRLGSRAETRAGGHADSGASDEVLSAANNDDASTAAQHSEGDTNDLNPNEGPDAHVSATDVSASDDDDGSQPEAQACERGAPALGPSPLSRLGNEELNNSIAHLLPSELSNLPWLPTTRDVRHWSAPPTASELDRVRTLAQAVAIELTSSREPGTWLSECDPIVQGEEECRKVLLDPLVERIVRRPLTDEDQSALTETFDLGRELGGTFETGVRAVLEVTLQGPEFLYLLEHGTGLLEGSAVQLTGHETAARLAMFLTAAGPDAQLREEAERGPMQLSTIETQARRLIADSHNQRAISRTLRDLLLPLEVSAKPELDWSPELARSADEATLRFIEAVTFQGAGTLDALLTQPTVWANAELANFFGYPLSGGDWQEFELDGSRAAGIFTQPGFLAATPHVRSSPVLRGLYVLRTLLCFEPPAPDTVSVVVPPPQAGATQRQQLEAFTAPSPCFDCHKTINPVGFAFEHYDAVGKWRDEDNGQPIDASGVLTVSDASGPFADAVELMHNIAETQAANPCFVERWLERAVRRELVSEDACFKADVTQDFRNHKGQIADLLLALVKDDHFRYRLAADLAP